MNVPKILKTGKAVIFLTLELFILQATEDPNNKVQQSRFFPQF